MRVDDAIEEALLGVVGPGAVAAAAEAARQVTEKRDQVREALGRDLEAARYAADRAFRQYDAAIQPTAWSLANLKRDGTGRSLVSPRWKAKSPRTRRRPRCRCIQQAMLGLLASNLKTLCSAPPPMAVKKRIVRTLIHEVLAYR